MSVRFVFLVFAVLALTARPTFAAGDVDKGRTLAKEHCARCHVVPGGSKFGGIGSTLSFQGLRNLPDWEERFATFFVRRPHFAFIRVEGVEPPSKLPAYAQEVKLTAEDVDHILAFARTVEPR